MRKERWERQGANIASRKKERNSKKWFPRPKKKKKKQFWEEINAFYPLFYRKWIWAMLIHGKCKFSFE